MSANTLREIIDRRKRGIVCGIPSYCTANELVIEACMEQAKRFDDPVLIEATANQVNQFGGYTGMRPADFRDFVYGIAKKINFPRQKIILGGDHLGPLTWAAEPEADAMQKAKDLVYEFVSAGFQKIHLDTSMRLGDDDADSPLTDEVIARRSAELYLRCEDAFVSMRSSCQDAVHPVFIIGSEVPIPGGAQEAEEGISVTDPSALEQTLRAYHSVFAQMGLDSAFENIIGIVVQPGVEFGDNTVFQFDPVAAADLSSHALKLEGMVLEGHSTDYQTPSSLKNMVRAGIAILKVGPALTFALREGLYALSLMERELFPPEKWVDFPQLLEKVMLESPEQWEKHYHGTEKELCLKRKYSYSDRCRYYLTAPEIQESIQALLSNMNSVDIPMGMLRQYMPVQYQQIQNGSLRLTAEDLVKSNIIQVVDDYNYAVKHNYFVSNALQ